MKVILHCEPNTPPLSWDEFQRSAPVGSIAVDGYVHGRVMWNEDRKILNLNHHEEVDRLSTCCTAAQAIMLIRCGMLEAFKNLPEIHLFCNDCDEDVCLTIWILRHGFISEGIINPILNRIVEVEDKLDTTAGAYGYPVEMPAMEENNWIFWDYKIARVSGALARRNADEFCAIIDAVGGRISKAVAGQGERTPLDARYTVVALYPDWALVTETGINARIAMYADGINAFVSARQGSENRTIYSIGRRSIFIPFNVTRILAALNELEGLTNDKWGGGDTIGGSPRSKGSLLTIDEVTRIVHQNK